MNAMARSRRSEGSGEGTAEGKLTEEYVERHDEPADGDAGRRMQESALAHPGPGCRLPHDLPPEDHEHAGVAWVPRRTRVSKVATVGASVRTHRTTLYGPVVIS